MGKPTICICETKGADQLRGNREADQRLCFRYSDSTIPPLLNPKFQASSHPLGRYRPVCVGPVKKPHCLFSHEAAHFTTDAFDSVKNVWKVPTERFFNFKYNQILAVSRQKEKTNNNEPHHEKTGFLHMRKQRRRSAVQ